MIAILLTTLFWTIAALAILSIAITVRHALPAIRELRAELDACKAEDATRYEWHVTKVRVARPARAGFRPSARPQVRGALPAAA